MWERLPAAIAAGSRSHRFIAMSELIKGSKLHGIVVPMVTPMTAEGDIDEDGLRSLTRYLVDAGVNGIFVMGTTGEFSYIAAEDQWSVVETVVEEVRPPYICRCRSYRQLHRGNCEKYHYFRRSPPKDRMLWLSLPCVTTAIGSCLSTSRACARFQACRCCYITISKSSDDAGKEKISYLRVVDRIAGMDKVIGYKGFIG